MAKQPKLKTYVLMVSQVFPAYHPRKGQETGFPLAIATDDKQHTVRVNYAAWKRKSDDINTGKAILSIRLWTGLPYRSKQHELMQLNHIDVQKVHIYNIPRIDEWLAGNYHTYIFIDNSIQPLRWPFKFAARDGLTMQDFLGWFKKPVENAALIHFTNFKY